MFNVRKSLLDIIKKNTLNRPQHIAIIDNNGSYAYQRLWNESNVLAQTMNSINNKKMNNIPIPVLCQRNYSYVLSLLASWKVGGIFTPLSIESPILDLKYYIKDLNPNFVVIDELTPYGKDLMRYCELEGLPYIQPFIKHGKKCEDNFISPQLNDSAMIVYTSGTTGPPKGVLHTHKSIAAQVKSLQMAWKWSKYDHILNILPMHHVHGIVNILFCSLASGATCEFTESTAPQKLIPHLNRTEITLFMAVPTIYSKLGVYLEKYPNQLKAPSIRLMVSGSAALPEPIFKQWQTKFGFTLLERYGMTEIGMALSNPLQIEHRQSGSVGYPLPGVQTKIDKETGELLIKAPQVFKEYWNKPDATEQSFDTEGYFKTGDIVDCTEVDSRYSILGRQSVDIIKFGGYKISALEIEAIILEHPNIREVAIVGLPDQHYGQKIGALVSTNNFQSITLVELREWCQQRLPKYKLVHHIQQVDSIPRNAMGKVNKKTLLSLFNNFEA